MAGSLLLGGTLRACHLPAALLVGPMVMAIALAVRGTAIRVPRLGYEAAQALVGLLIARAITPTVVALFLHRAGTVLLVASAAIAVSAGIGWLWSRARILPGTTAIWGLLPGAASAMMVMADAFGADARLVAFMQYTRVLVVVATASVVARVVVPAATAAAPGAAGPGTAAPAHAGAAVAASLGIAAGALLLGRLLRVPAGPLLLALVGGAALHLGGVVTLPLPPWLLIPAYAALGWSIGLRFDRPILAYAARRLLPILAGVVAMILACAAIGMLLLPTLHLSALSAYLATSPGGADSVAIIAASLPVDAGFIMTLQTLRFLLVLAVGPPLARALARRFPPGGDAPPRA